MEIGDGFNSLWTEQGGYGKLWTATARLRISPLILQVLDEQASGASSHISDVLPAAVVRLDMDNDETTLQQKSQDVDKPSGRQYSRMLMTVSRCHMGASGRCRGR